MVIGNGLVANAFKTYAHEPLHIVFASGASNSTSVDAATFQRERDLLEQTIEKYPGKSFIYFGTCSVYDKFLTNSKYVQHKLEMETLIATTQSDYIIFRISNLAGVSKNPTTVLNYFLKHIQNDTFFSVWKYASRNIIDVEDAFDICDYIIKKRLFKKQIVNVANPHNNKVIDIVTEIENFLGKKGNYEIIEKSSNPVIDVSKIEPLFNKLQIDFGKSYLKKVISKYYSVHNYDV